MALTLLLAYVAARLCVWLHTPIPWMIGPLVATSLASVLGARTESWVPFRNAGQWVIGAALGLYFTPAVGALVAGLWWAIALGIAWALALGLGFGAWLRHQHGAHLSSLTPAQLSSTTYFAAAIGGASEMTLIAERHGARTDLVAAAHSLRVLMVTLTIPFALQFWGVQGIDRLPDALREVPILGPLYSGLLSGHSPLTYLAFLMVPALFWPVARPPALNGSNQPWRANVLKRLGDKPLHRRAELPPRAARRAWQAAPCATRFWVRR